MKIYRYVLVAFALASASASFAQRSSSPVPPSPPSKKAPIPTLKGDASYYDQSWDTYRVLKNGKKVRVGNFTQSGEAFDHRLDTAACGGPGDLRYQKRHALVTNRKNGKELVVWINDTGGFYSHKAFSGGKRVIDLAQGAAKRLGITGLGQVMVQIFPPNFCINRAWPQAKKLALAHEFLSRYLPKPPAPPTPPASLAQTVPVTPVEPEPVEITVQATYSEAPFKTKDFLHFDEDHENATLQPEVISYGPQNTAGIPVIDDDAEDENVHQYKRYDVQ